jgi:hypothetical protein
MYSKVPLKGKMQLRIPVNSNAFFTKIISKNESVTEFSLGCLGSIIESMLPAVLVIKPTKAIAPLPPQLEKHK